MQNVTNGVSDSHAHHFAQPEREQLMGQNIFSALAQAITQLLSTQGNTLQATGLDIFRGLAVILIVWFGIKAALSASQGQAAASTSPSSPT